jgi:hypothetical protein
MNIEKSDAIAALNAEHDRALDIRDGLNAHESEHKARKRSYWDGYAAGIRQAVNQITLQATAAAPDEPNDAALLNAAIGRMQDAMRDERDGPSDTEMLDWLLWIGGIGERDIWEQIPAHSDETDPQFEYVKAARVVIRAAMRAESAAKPEEPSAADCTSLICHYRGSHTRECVERRASEARNA